MVEPVEASKPNNWDAMLASLAGLFMAISAYLYRKSGKIPRPEPSLGDPDNRRWDSVLEKLEEINRSLSDTHDLAVETREGLIRLEVRFDALGRRLARMEGQQSGD
jgi:hypothetical protein